MAIMKALAKNTLAEHPLPTAGYEECWYRWPNASVRCKSSYFATVYRRLAPRCGHKRAIVAVAH